MRISWTNWKNRMNVGGIEEMCTVHRRATSEAICNPYDMALLSEYREALAFVRAKVVPLQALYTDEGALELQDCLDNMLGFLAETCEGLRVAGEIMACREIHNESLRLRRDLELTISAPDLPNQHSFVRKAREWLEAVERHGPALGIGIADREHVHLSRGFR
jgi:hypothetical protein